MASLTKGIFHRNQAYRGEGPSYENPVQRVSGLLISPCTAGLLSACLLNTLSIWPFYILREDEEFSCRTFNYKQEKLKALNNRL
jgi:hypothetical protein